MEQINTFSKGMNMDLGVSIMPPDTYPYAENLRLISDGSNENYELTNVKGNELLYELPVLSDTYKITAGGVDLVEGMPFVIDINVDGRIKSINTRFTAPTVHDLYRMIYEYLLPNNQLILAYNASGVVITTQGKSSFSIKKKSGHHSGILVQSVFGTSRLFHPQIIGYCAVREDLYLFSCSAASGQIWKIVNDLPVLIYHNALNLSTDYPIKAIGFYNNDTNVRAYFTDFHNNLRQCNLGDPMLLAMDPKDFEIINTVSLSTPTVDSIGYGNLKCGKVFYAYQLFKLHGPLTKFSDLSYGVNLSSSSLSDSSSRDYRGGDIDVSSNKSCSVVIDDIDQTFDYIRVVSVFYDTLLGLPTIKIIAEKSVPSSGAITIVDTGNENLGTYTMEEFNAIGGTLFKCKDIATKNNLLVAANIEEEFFDVDFDFRAYRANSTGRILLKDAYGTELDVASGYVVDSGHDCIQSKSDQYTYKYNEDGYLGGSGPNVKYEFKIKQITLDSQYTTPGVYSSNKVSQSAIGFTTNPYYGDYSSPVNGQFVGYQRDEVYSFAAVCVDEKGRQSFAYWIADIKFPAMSDTDNRITHANKYTYDITYNQYANVLYPVFTFKNKPINPNTGLPYEIKVVRMKRDQKDRSIVAQGLTTPTYSVTPEIPSPFLYRIIGFGSFFVSPDVIIAKKQGGETSIVGGDTLSSIVNMTISTHPIDTSQFQTELGVYTYRHYVNKFKPHSFCNYNGIIVGAATLNTNESAVIGTETFSNIKLDSQPVHSLGIKTAIQTINFNKPTTDYVVLSNIIRNLSSQYGGNTFDSRTSRQYIDCVQSNGSVFGGDTYICMFDYLSRFLNANEDWAVENYMFENWFFPVETIYNLTHRTDYPYNTHKGNPTGNPVRLQEYAGFYTDSSNSYTQEKDLYLYNTVYNKENDLRTYFAKPLTYEGIKKYDCRILVSERKLLNEETDSWTTFFPQNYLDIDTTRGPINAVVNDNNNIFCIQDTGVGVASIDERSVIQDNNVSQLVLGTGGVLVRYDYLNVMAGTKHKWSVVSTPKGSFFYDAINKSINHISGTNITDVKGLKSYIEDLDVPENPHAGGVSGMYDSLNRELVYSFPDKTLSLSLLTETPQCFYTYTTPQFIHVRDNMYSVLRGETDKVYRHNTGYYQSFYGQTNDSMIRVFVNQSYATPKIFNACICDFNQTVNGVSQQQGFWTSMKAWNNYQYTGELNFRFNSALARYQTIRINDILYTRKNRLMSFFIPRNAVSANIETNSDIFANVDLTRTFRERMKDHSLTLELTHSESKRMHMSYLQTNFSMI